VLTAVVTGAAATGVLGITSTGAGVTGVSNGAAVTGVVGVVVAGVAATGVPATGAGVAAAIAAYA